MHAETGMFLKVKGRRSEYYSIAMMIDTVNVADSSHQLLHSKKGQTNFVFCLLIGFFANSRYPVTEIFSVRDSLRDMT